MENIYYIKGDTLLSIANSLRNKTNTGNPINPTNMSKMIDNLSGPEDLSSELAQQDELITAIGQVLERRAQDAEDLSDEIVQQNELISALSEILNTKMGI